MGKNEIRVIHVPRWITVFGWLAVSAAMASGTYLLSGRAYARETRVADIVAMLHQFRVGSATSSAVLASIAPAIADLLFFLPWGALAFLSLDRAGRPVKATYGTVLILGVAFALGLMAWQQMLPTRITSGVDTLWNVAGCACGAALGLARKRVRVRFE